jgi:hypothetical protein
MLSAGYRKRSQPPPPRVVFEALTEPDHDPARPWLFLLADEQPPEILEAVEPSLVVWSSLWTTRPDARVRFDLAPDDAGGTMLAWTLQLADPMPDDSKLGHLRRRLNILINASLRATWDQ